MNWDSHRWKTSTKILLGLVTIWPIVYFLAVKNDRLDQTMRIIWVVLFCMFAFFAMPVYWYLYVWRKPPVSLPGSDLNQFSAESTANTL